RSADVLPGGPADRWHGQPSVQQHGVLDHVGRADGDQRPRRHLESVLRRDARTVDGAAWILRAQCAADPAACSAGEVMASQYLTRAADAAPAPGTPPEAPDPQIAAVLTVATPILAVLIGWGLLNAIAIGNSTSYSISYTGVRAAITQALDK